MIDMLSVLVNKVDNIQEHKKRDGNLKKEPKRKAREKKKKKQCNETEECLMGLLVDWTWMRKQFLS